MRSQRFEKRFLRDERDAKIRDARSQITDLRNEIIEIKLIDFDKIYKL